MTNNVKPKRENLVKPIRVKCSNPKCGHTQLSVLEYTHAEATNPIPMVNLCEMCGAKSDFFEHLVKVKKRRRRGRKEMIPPPLFDSFDQPIIYP